ncbi:MAG: hypothetical protein J6Q13_03560, partial [Clostridia bacterium]|nr:hypothetical protein [Clostridia bacterium]
SSGENVISYDSADLSYGYLSYQNYNKSKAYIDTYIEDLINYKSNYIKGINCDEADDFALFRRVYYSIEGKSLSADSLSLEMKNGADVTNVKFHIYLANGQNTGDLPVFEKDFYTLIYWKNIAENEELTTENKHYVYPTEEFDREDEQHWAEIKRGSDWLYGIRDGGLGFNNVWYYSDGYNADNSVTFEAGYFRKRYDLNIQTYLEDILSRRGYVMIDIYDNLHAEDNNMTDTGGRYIAIFETGRGTSVMELYQVLADSTLQTDTSLDAKKLDSVINATGKITSTKVDFPIKLYAGCDITMKVYDQSQDSEAMSTGFFDEMIGYKFSGKVDGEVREGASVVEKSLLFSAENATNYVFSLNEDEVEAKDYVNGAEIDINVYFEKIVYNINFEIDNVKAGEFNVQANTQFSGYKTKYTLNNMIVDDYYSVNYYAYAGFKLQEDAFVLNNGKSVSTLKTYDDANVLADSQDYTLTTANVTPDFYGTWLRLYFYNDYDLYPVDKTNIGTIIIKTEAIEFVYGVKIYDETNTTLADDNYILETFYYVVDESGNPVLDSGGKLQRTTEMVEGTTYATISLDEKTGIKAVYNVNTYLTKENLDFWYYNSLGGTNYALLSSRMWFPNNQTTTTKNSFYTTYEFLIDSENGPEDKFELSTYILEYMVDNYEDGKIISNNDRNIYIMLEVRRLLEIDMRVGVLDKDTNSTSRITTLSNSTNNSKSIILRANAGKVNNLAYSLSAIMGYYYVDTNNNASLVVYSYYGLENRLTSVYDDTRYTGVEYYLNGASEKMTENKFTLDADATLEIVYIPSSLAVEFVYSLDSGSSLQIVNYDEIKEYINDENVLKPNTYSMYYMNDIVTYMVECIHADYNLRVTINGVVKGSTGTVRKVQTYHTITDMDYEIGSVKIEVDVYLKNNSQITIKYQLLNPEQREADDDYGTFSVVDDAENQNTTSCAVTVIEGRSVYVTLNLNTGYRYAGKIKHSTNDAEEVSIVDEKLLIVSSYNPETDNGDYLIMVEKQLISAALDTTGLQASYSINGTKELTGLYVGKTITLEHTDVNEERLGCFYYLASRYDEGSGTYQPYNVYLTEDGTQTGNPLTSLKITSALLEQVNSSIIQFKVVAINRYKLDLVIEGEEYKKADSLQVKFTTFDGANWVAGEDYVLGSYCDEGTNITVAVETLVEGKYTITFNSTYDVLNLNDEIISLDENKQLTLEIAPKTYNVVIEENVYTTLAEVATSSPKVETSQVNGVDNSQKQQTYNNLTILEFRRFIEDVESVDDRELSEVYITGNDFEDLILIEFNGDEFEVYKVVGDVKNPTKKELVDLSSYGFAIELTGYGTVRLTYTTFNNINVRFDYKLYKTIRVE